MVEIERVISFEELEAKVRAVPLLSQDSSTKTQPYVNAHISLQEFSYDDIAPTTLYVLTKNLETQDMLSNRLSQLGHDPLSLEGGLELADANGDVYGLVPPIVEETPEGMCLIDGIHRNYMPRLLGRTSFIGLAIENVDSHSPFYAYPN